MTDEILGCMIFTIALGGDACNPRNASVITDVAYKLWIDRMCFSLKTYFVWLGQYLFIFGTRNKILMDFFCAANNEERLETDPPEPQILIP